MTLCMLLLFPLCIPSWSRTGKFLSLTAMFILNPYSDSFIHKAMEPSGSWVRNRSEGLPVSCVPVRAGPGTVQILTSLISAPVEGRVFPLSSQSRPQSCPGSLGEEWGGRGALDAPTAKPLWGHLLNIPWGNEYMF